MTELDSPFVPLSERTAFLIAQLGFSTAYRFTDALAPLGIGPRHFGTLRLLEANDGQTQQQLCDTLRIHRNVMVGLVDDLEKRGLVERRRHPSDRRAYAVHLLPAARELLARAEPIVRELDTAVLAPLDAAEQATLRKLLEKLSAAAGLTPGVHPGLTRGLGPSC
ncbi:MarR family winged helix-turn-helix transcriptional regulator [Nocardia blacklockiae]|uniref:MarR family winged helix-turn-helix transcriptional regulator n=1 Tax=Nocardia blacklockiae TaxID=480036 RepID=UPI001895E5DF|nr:MarR family transcriptional regulator [Nocardia blacklockiae]MBF6175492.1 MarR family transcriptional regulator [Nocardia blacklockiae]